MTSFWSDEVLTGAFGWQAAELISELRLHTDAPTQLDGNHTAHRGLKSAFEPFQTQRPLRMALC